MKVEHRCKLCVSPEWVYKAILLYKCSGYSYKQIIEHFSRYVKNLNLYNLSTHMNRHVQQGDIEEAEATLTRWESYKSRTHGVFCDTEQA